MWKTLVTSQWIIVQSGSILTFQIDHNINLNATVEIIFTNSVLYFFDYINRLYQSKTQQQNLSNRHLYFSQIIVFLKPVFFFCKKILALSVKRSVSTIIIPFIPILFLWRKKYNFSQLAKNTVLLCCPINHKRKLIVR